MCRAHPHSTRPRISNVNDIVPILILPVLQHPEPFAPGGHRPGKVLGELSSIWDLQEFEEWLEHGAGGEDHHIALF